MTYRQSNDFKGNLLGGTATPPWRASWVLLLWATGVLSACTNAQFEQRDAGIATRDAPVSNCTPGTGNRSKGKAQPCACDDECQSGFCSGGVCCTSSCHETCKACNLPSSIGDCAFVPAGGKPDDLSVCAPSAPRTCGQDGTCDGRGACRLYVQGTECQPGHCDGDRVADILTCDGSGHCEQSISKPCPPYTCDPETDSCAFACTTDDMCAAGGECIGGRCGTSPNGAVCRSAEDCSSGYCVDGVCCNIACDAPCVSCDQTGSVGRCSVVSTGIADPDCEADDVSTCGHTGRCDGTGSCALYPENTVCAASSCSGVQENAARTCDGRGTCRDAQLIDCTPYLCSEGTCETSCDPTRSDSCADGLPCVPLVQNGVTIGVCGPRKNGQQCSDASDCESGECVDGVCCESACEGACRSCNLPGSPGRCLNVAAGAPDPHNTCQDVGASLCSTNGVCDGKGGCQVYSAGTPCGGQACVDGIYSPPPTCNASGQCVPSRARACSPYICNGDVCFNTCSSAAECTPGGICANGSCGLKPLGADCASGTECASGFCAQGVCCDSACSDACLSCNLTTSAGTCSAVSDGAPDPQGRCVATSPVLCGTTGACQQGACALYAQGMYCAAPVCTSPGTLRPTSTCDGKGVCLTPLEESCGGFACSNGACKSSCTPATEAVDCVPPETCVNGSCGLKTNGAPCTDPRQCSSGICTEGVCCNTSCADALVGGLCMTCKGTQTVPAGTCARVVAGTLEPKSRCPTTPEGTCGTTGNCNASGGCEQRTLCTPNVTGCPADLSTQYSGGACLAGVCTAQTSGCNPGYLCVSGGASLGACATNCNDANESTHCDVAKGYSCIGEVCQKKGMGFACAANIECASGHCVNGACCVKDACTICYSCNVSEHAGDCYPVPADEDDTRCVASCPLGGNARSGGCNGSGTCQGAGTCPGGAMCGANNRCATDCSTVGCAAGFYCDGTDCQPLKDDGDACTANGECTNGHCLSDGSSTICCATVCTDVPCVTRAVCALDGSGCQTYAAGDDCDSGEAACNVDDPRSSWLSTGTCEANACQRTPQPCDPGYLCVGTKCVEEGECTPESGCDTENNYVCNGGTCVLEPPEIDGGS